MTVCVITYTYRMGLEHVFNSSPLEQNGHHFGRWHFEINFLEWKCWIQIQISLKFVSRSPDDNKQALVQAVEWVLIQ